MIDLKQIEDQLISCDECLKNTRKIVDHLNAENTKINFDDTLCDLKTDLDDQLRKIRKKDFEIAVVGREKAGKSSLLNAWIGFNLLPNERNRCTYTTTEIRSCSSLDDQKYLIEYFTTEEFSDKISQTQSEDSSGVKSIDNLRNEELIEIKNCMNEIEDYLDRLPEMKNFRSFDEVRLELKSAISKPGHARAVKKICIWTPKLSESENVVLYDVPGYDSPIQLHKEQTKQKIASVDAVLYAKQFCSPDLVDCEVEILKITDSNNAFIKAKDKIIVALTNCDLANSAREFDELVIKSKKSWRANEILDERIIPVCSLADLGANTPEEAKALKNLKDLNGGDSGLKQLKKAVNDCIIDSRSRISVDRCNELKNRIKDVSKTLMETVKDKYNLDLNTKVDSVLKNDEMDKIYSEWWTKQWRSIHEEFQTFFITTIRPRLSPDASSHLNEDDLEFKKLYENMIEETFRAIPSTKRDRQLLIYNSVMTDGIVSPKEGNTKIRTELSNNAIEILDKITIKLNLFLWQTIDKMIAWMRKRLWNLPEIREEVVSSDENLESQLMQRSFDSLIQRLARPATQIFLRFPRSKVERLRVMNEYQMELLVLDKFLLNGRIVDRGLISFLASGKLGKFEFNFKQDDVVVVRNAEAQVETNSENRGSNQSLNTINLVVKQQKKLGIFSKIKNKTEKKEEDMEDKVSIKEEAPKVLIKGSPSTTSQFEVLQFSRDSDTFDQIHAEIESDLCEFIESMKNSVFYGSGIQRYYNQELDKIRRKFLDLENNKRRWHYYVFKYLKNKDLSAKVNIPAPNMDDEIKHRANVITFMKDINSIVEQFNF